MIITKTPFRISFFGGGTDYPVWFRENGGSVLSTSIDKYCYISCRYLPKFFDHSYRFVYSEIEDAKTIDQIRHPAIKGVLQWLEWTEGIEMHHDADLPARSGLGSSSSFTVGLLNALNAIKGRLRSKNDLARDAIHVEQEVIKEPVGSQDQIVAAYGGFNQIDFFGHDSFSVNPVILQEDRRQELEGHLLLFFTGISRYASEVARAKLENIPMRHGEMTRIQGMVPRAMELLSTSTSPITGFGDLLHEAWEVKRSLSSKVSSPVIDKLYEDARKAGAIGGKLLGAGGGGFMLLFAPPDRHDAIRARLAQLTYVPFKFEHSGTTVALYQPSGF